MHHSQLKSPLSFFAIILVWMLLFFCSNSAANTWTNINAMAPDQLGREITRLQTQYDSNGLEFYQLKKLGIAYHFKAIKEMKAYAPKAVETLTQARTMDEKDPEVLCFLGSATTMMARTTFNPVKKMKFVRTGISYMDKAVDLAPANITIRMTRGINTMYLPDFLNRKKIAVADFEYLAALLDKKSNKLGSIRTSVYQNLVKLYEEKGEMEKAQLLQKKLQKQ
jgi:hypothetical protein